MELSQGLCMLPGTLFYRRFGPRLTIAVGSVVSTAGIALANLAVDKSLAWVEVTYGFLNGLGVGLVYTVPILVGYKWFPKNKGLVSGVVVGGYGLGGIIFTTMQTSFINPDNVSPEDDGFFHDEALLDRVPNVFLLQAGVCVGLQLVGFLGVRDPPSKTPQSDSAPEAANSELKTESEAEITGELRRGGDVSKHSVAGGARNVYSVKEALRTLAIYQLLLGYILNTFPISFIIPLWKAFGQTFIKDDFFLELVGSGSSVFNMLGRIAWGFSCDLFGYKPVMVLMSGLFCSLMLTLQSTSEGGKVMFLIWIWAIFLCFSGTFSVVITGTAETFGAESAGQIYGLIFVVGSMLSIFSSFLNNLLLDRYGYSLLLLVTGLINGVGFIVTLTFRPPKRRTVD
ncbi:oxalate:formate antiporter-like [Pollicipes pollicipes]|uniref:oxalate:formate antiporter-like n=1 Tax=Pollicipes pollicipes TaxID=41117 RepID=UPI001885A0FE|nr:oxalate:formate antiporter-like [Pollicipes pollicipes]